MSILLAAYLLVASTGDAQATNAAPAVVRAYIRRRTGCNHWAGEEGYDAERRREIMRAVRELRCRTIDQDERLLKRRYARNGAVLRLLQRASDADVEP